MGGSRPTASFRAAPLYVLLVSEALLLSTFMFLAARDVPSEEISRAVAHADRACTGSFNGSICGSQDVFLPCMGGVCTSCMEHVDCNTFEGRKSSFLNDAVGARCNSDRGVCEKLDNRRHDTAAANGKIILLLSAALANAGGLAGGTLFVPTFILMLGFSTSRATAASQAMVTGGSLAAYAYQLFRRHPEEGKPLIDYDLVTAILPPVLFGGSIGVFLFRVFPQYCSSFLLTALLAFVSIFSSRRAWLMMFNDEKLKHFCSGATNSTPCPRKRNDEVDLRHVLPEHQGSKTEASLIHAVFSLVDRVLAPRQHRDEWLIERRKRAAPTETLSVIGVVWALVALFSVLRTKAPCSSSLFWALLFVQEAALLLLGMSGSVWLYYTSQRVSSLMDRRSLRRTEKVWNCRESVWFFVFNVVTGVLAAWIGIGPAAITTPALVILVKLDPQTVQASSSIINLVSSSAVVAQMAASRQLDIPTAVSYGSRAFIGAILGLSCANFIIVRYKLTSVIVVVLAIVFWTSLGLSLQIAADSWHEARSIGAAFLMRPICG
eukprot:Plantae.Rhodophyta-Purpureofilum_apyrenoidigerum.ctg8273.p1 GENE.Plantae.Rhodophyta-Purpureofilum_apyrenoidigerum.ctg8273~~Plantae.Rhodophyta-Purpureofilum_apyrenoidigerum.ctg8273.p1  ORF type:complete len:548 (-),score=60.34 Plantae.Rhodophyta-Purpureofilum_apyrenoidigerum.ctg8273:36-1679(-)